MGVLLEKPEEFEAHSLTILERARNIAIVDQETYDLVARELIGLADVARVIIAHHKPIKDTANLAHKAACAAEKRVLEPVQIAIGLYKSKIARWEDEQARLKRERDRAAQQAAWRQSQEIRLATAREAERMGSSRATVAKIIETPLVLPVAHVTPTFTRAHGITPSKRWHAEVQDKMKLIRFVAENPRYAEFLEPNLPALNRLVNAFKESFSIPGVDAVEDTNITTRRY